MEEKKKEGRYGRIYNQLSELVLKSNSQSARMATIVAVLHHKMDYFFWTGFYILTDGELIVGPYQGPVACIKLKKDIGVCWAGFNEGETIVVPNVHEFPGHIACDSRSNSEIDVPVRDNKNTVIAVLDVDSKNLNSFNEIDLEYLEKIMLLLK